MRKILCVSIVLASLLNVALSEQYLYQQCGGRDWLGGKKCAQGLTCFYKDSTYAQCLYGCNWGWQCQPAEYDMCDGEEYSGSKACLNGLTCQKKDKYYSQCLRACPTGQRWECEGATTGTNTGTNTGTGTGVSTGTTGGSSSLSYGNKFPYCQFRFGAEFKGGDKDYSHLDYISIWIGYDDWGMVDMLKTAQRFKKIPLFYGYLIAFLARQMWGLKDCDVGTPSLCQKGSLFIRENRAVIINKYRHFATESAKIIGRDAEMIWLIEPDFWQYHGDTHQEGGPNSGQFMRDLFDDIAKVIKESLPNARISWDISAWLSEYAMRQWWGNFASSPYIDYIHTSGGQSRGALPNIKDGERTWKFMADLTGKKIIGDTGYGVAGNGQGHNWEWDDLNNLKNRLNDGVIAVTQANARWDWGGTINYLKQNLAKVC